VFAQLARKKKTKDEAMMVMGKMDDDTKQRRLLVANGLKTTKNARALRGVEAFSPNARGTAATTAGVKGAAACT
jgi:hypothetical protein